MLAQSLPPDLFTNLIIVGGVAIIALLAGGLFIASCEVFNSLFKKRVPPLHVPKPEFLTAIGLYATILGLNALIWGIVGAALTQKKTLVEIRSHMTFPIWGIIGLISLTVDAFLISFALPTTFVRGLTLLFIQKGIVLTIGLPVLAILWIAS